MSDNEFMDKIQEFSQGAAESMSEISDMTVDMANRMARFQVAAIRSYAKFGIARIKEAGKVNDLNSMQEYTASQIDEMQTISKNLARDARQIVDLTGDYTDRIRRITQKDISRWGSLASIFVVEK